MGRISRFPIDLRRRPYNTLALPCECVTSTSVHVYKATFNLLPTNFVTYFQINSVVHSYNTRHLQDYHISSIRTAKRLKTLRHSGPRIWISLPSKIKAINNFNSLTKSVKSSLLDVYV